jgi:hypothetical protein
VTPASRVVAVVAGIACLLLACVALVRQAALAADAAVHWPVSTWWTDLTTASPSWTTTGVAAVAAAAVTAGLFFLAFRQIGESGGPEIIEFTVDEGTARLSVPALGKALRRRFQAMLPGSQVTGVAVRKNDWGWSVRVEASVPVCDLGDVHAAMLDAFRDDMRRVAGVDLARLDLVVTSMRAPARRA